MTGWLIAIGLALVAGAALWRFGGLPRVAREPVLAALIVGIAGYALQGSPGFMGNPVSARAQVAKVDEEAIAKRNQLGQRFGSAVAWLIASDGALRAGLTQNAVTFVKSGLRESPDSPELWVGLGNALVSHGNGRISPAAIYAFERAAQLAPDHPSPPLFLGMALAQSGELEQARTVWLKLLAKTPPDAPWRGDLEVRIDAINAMTGRGM